MKAPTRTISATKLRAKCGALIAMVQKTGGELVITKHGKPVAKLVATARTDTKTSRGSIKGRVRGDIVYLNLWEPVR